MRDVLPTLETWAAEGRRFATATVTKTWGSSPRPVGETMGVRDDGLICGSVSGGCVEAAVIEASLAALADGKPREMTFEPVDEDSLWDVGLSCGGKIQVWIDPDLPGKDAETWKALLARARADEPAILVTTYAPPATWMWQPGSPDPFGGILERAYTKGVSGEVEIEDKRVFLNVLTSRPRLVIVGAVHIAVPLVKFAKELGFEIIIVDPRATFANIERFPTPPDRLFASWPEEAFAEIGLTGNTFVAVLTHDPKIDGAALEILLRSPVAYIGALGGRKTQSQRHAQLLERGFSEEDLARIHGPIGLNIGAKSPEEIALSIVAEIVQLHGRSGSQ